MRTSLVNYLMILYWLDNIYNNIYNNCCYDITSQHNIYNNHQQMFKLITATVDNEWLEAKGMDKYDFLDSVRNKGCKVLLEKSTLSIECSFDQLQELYRSYGDDRVVEEAQDVAEDEQRPGHFDANSVTDKVILDGYLWDYMDRVYGNEISLMEGKYDVSIEKEEARNGLVTLTLKPKKLRMPVDIMAVQEKILEMREYIDTLQSVVLSTVSVESVVIGRLDRTHFQDISKYLEVKYRDVVLKRTINGFRVIGPVESCNAIKKRFSKRPLIPDSHPLKNLKTKRPLNEDYLPGHSGYKNISSGYFIRDWNDEYVGIFGEGGRDQNTPPGEDIGVSKLSGESKAELELSENADEQKEEQVAFTADDNLMIDNHHALQTHETGAPSDDGDNSDETAPFESAKSEPDTSLGQSMALDEQLAEEIQQQTNNSQTSVFSSNILDQELPTKHYETDEPDEHLEITDVTEIELPKKARKKLPNIAYSTYVAPEEPEIIAKTCKGEAKERLRFDSDSDYSD